MTQRLNNNKGLTLMELLVSIAVFSILFIAITMFVFPTMTMFAKTRDIAEAKSIANLAMDYIEGSVYSTNELTLRPYTASPDTEVLPADAHLLSFNAGRLQLYRQTTPVTPRTDAISQGITAGYTMDISFSKEKAATKILRVTITVNKTNTGERLFELTKDIFLTNMLGDTATIGGTEIAPYTYPEILFYRPDGSEVLTPP